MNRLQLGDRIQWKRFGQMVTGTVVRIQRYGWCSGASEIVALSDEALPTSFHMGIGYEVIDGHELIASALERYKAHLSEYPAWRENFARGVTVGCDWGEFDGFRRIRRAAA